MKETRMRRTARPRRYGPLLWLVAAVAALLLSQLVAALIEEVPRLLKELR
jgi:hypothetical protein